MCSNVLIFKYHHFTVLQFYSVIIRGYYNVMKTGICKNISFRLTLQDYGLKFCENDAILPWARGAHGAHGPHASRLAVRNI